MAEMALCHGSAVAGLDTAPTFPGEIHNDRNPGIIQNTAASNTATCRDVTSAGVVLISP
jgi:hypothetical protein